jgi:hypothetical protein
VTKPSSCAEIAARFAPIIRTLGPARALRCWVHKDIELSTVSGSVTVDEKAGDAHGEEIPYTEIIFMHRRGRVIRRTS